MCESQLDHRLLMRETEARLAGVKVNETLTEKMAEEDRGLFAWVWPVLTHAVWARVNAGSAG